MASTIQPLNDTTELVELLGAQRLYLKPISRLNITVQLPALKDPTKSISNWDIMEKLKRLIAPGYFSSIKVSKSSLEFVRFEAEVDNRETLQKTIKTLDNANLKVIGFFDTLKVKASEAKSEFPTKHMWDSYFRDAKNVDETKPGERPDTLYLDKLPSKWFQDMRPNKGQASRDQAQASEFVLRRVFEVFGDIRCVDIPQLDPSRMATCIPLMKPMASTSSTEPGSAPGPSYASGANAIRPFNFGADFTFDAYVQYVEYIGFVKAMDALRNMKLVHIDQDEGKAWAASIKVDFDRSKHLSDKNIRRRRIIREKFLREEKIRLEKLRKEEEERQRKIEEERLRTELERKFLEKQILDRRRDREEKRKIKKLEEKRKEEENKIEQKIKCEERKLTVAQRKLESIRLLGDLFKLVKPLKLKEKVERELLELEDAQRREYEEKMRQKREEELKREKYMRKKESELRERVLKNYNEIEYQREEYKREQIRKMVRSNGGLLSSVVATSSAPKKSHPYQNQYQKQSLTRSRTTNRADFRANNRYYYPNDHYNDHYGATNSGRYYEDGSLSDYYDYEYVPLPKRHRVVYESFL